MLLNVPESMSIEAQDKLAKLSDRLYCAWQCVQMGDSLFIGHEEKVGSVLYGIWQELEDLLEAEEGLNARIREEMKKFTEGFAYRPSNGQVMD